MDNESLDLSFLGKEWQGFRINGEVIENDEGDFVHPRDIRAIRYLYTATGITRWHLLKANNIKH